MLAGRGLGFGERLPAGLGDHVRGSLSRGCGELAFQAPLVTVISSLLLHSAFYDAVMV
jgi:hypothetical protein